MLIKCASDISSSEITSEKLYNNRREFIKAATAVLGIASAGSILSACAPGVVGAAPEPQAKGKYDTVEKLTPLQDVTMFNNYYEFGTGKDDPAKNSKNFKPKPWTVKVDGLVKKPNTSYSFDDLIKGMTLEDRIYRMRCVEAWSMVIPWQGFPLADLIKKLEPLPAAKFIEFKTLVDPNQFPVWRAREKMEECKHRVRLASTKICLQLNNRITAIFCQSLDCSREETFEAFG